MITALVQFKLPAPVTLDQAQAIFSDAAPKFCDLPGLIRKYFLLSEDGETAGGVYLWKSREDANRFYTSGFRQRIVEQYGSEEPSITYFGSPVVVDNLTGETITTG
ncbi:MAG: YdhR family protein [Chroococcidiopsidaceae cyanobacterium CP_BM_ER_R8_30]|nr:YdhR family protein [Chroococcidiopsidaceae cyanobacterium CP_BM_ER_R8_30]